jgi:hypothetical protein
MDHDDVSQLHPMPDGAARAEPNAADAPIAPVDHRLMFQAELAHAMHIAAGQERDRIAAAILDDAEFQVDWTRARAAVESAEMRRDADDDVERIRAWSEAEIERIREEATRRTHERNAVLDTVLQRHHEMIETEVEAVTTAVDQYETKLDQFFVDMTSSTDPAYIVRQADLIPHPPNLEIVRASARSDVVARFQDRDESATAEGTGALVDVPHAVGVGVMDPAAINATPNVAELAEGQQGGPPDEGEAVGVGDPSGAHPNPAVRFWRSVAALSAPITDSTGGPPGQRR